MIFVILCLKVIIISCCMALIVMHHYTTECVAGQRSVSKWAQHTTRTKPTGDAENLCKGDEAPHTSPRLCPHPSLPWGRRTQTATAPVLLLHPTIHCTEYPDRWEDTFSDARAPLQAQITFTRTFGQLLHWSRNGQLTCFTNSRGETSMNALNTVLLVVFSLDFHSFNMTYF